MNRGGAMNCRFSNFHSMRVTTRWRRFPLSPSEGERAGVRGKSVVQAATLVPTLLFLFLLFIPLASRADELTDKGKAIFKQNQRVVLTVEIVLKNKMSMAGRSGESSESRQDVTGTVIDPSGLTVLSLSAIDPGQLLQNMMS